MWQIEDIIRAYGCSLPVIKKNYVDRFDFTPEQREEELDWFGNLIRMMNEEGKREGGHLNINKVILKDVIDLHGMLLQSTKFPIYNAEYYKVLPFIVELRQRGDKDLNEIETCLDALYGVMMLRLQRERMVEGLVPSLEQYHHDYGLTEARLRRAAPDAVVLHPGPMNRGVEIDDAVADGPQSLVLRQVANGVAVRMAVLEEVLG